MVDNSGSFDCKDAWESGFPFVHVKSTLFKQAMADGDIHMEYPYEEFFNAVATKILTIDSMKNGREIVVHYKWEPLDESIVIYSMRGKIVYADISINDQELGFLLDSTESDIVCAFPYGAIFWIEEANIQ